MLSIHFRALATAAPGMHQGTRHAAEECALTLGLLTECRAHGTLHRARVDTPLKLLIDAWEFNLHDRRFAPFHGRDGELHRHMEHVVLAAPANCPLCGSGLMAR